MDFFLAGTDQTEGSWLPPLDQLPDTAKLTIILLCLGAGCAIILWLVIRGLKILVLGEIWEFDGRSQLVTCNNKRVASFDEIRDLRIVGDVDAEQSTVTLAIATRADRTIRIAEGSLTRSHLERFIEVAQRVRARTCGSVDGYWSASKRTLVLCYEMAQEFAQLYRDLVIGPYRGASRRPF